MCQENSVDCDGLRAADRQAAKRAILVEDECRAIARPVRCFEVRGINLLNAAIAGSDRNRFKRAQQNQLAGGRRQRFEFGV
jgi:hypothetical protein